MWLLFKNNEPFTSFSPFPHSFPKVYLIDEISGVLLWAQTRFYLEIKATEQKLGVT